MTCVVGLIRNGKVMIGADSAGTGEDHSIKTRTDRKLWVTPQLWSAKKPGYLEGYVNGYAIGFAGSFRAGQIARYCFSPSLPDGSLLAYMVKTFVPELRAMLEAHDYFPDKAEDTPSFLVGHAGQLFHIGTDFQVEESTDLYNAIGSGAEQALGALYALRESTLSQADQITIALRAAAHGCSNVREPFHFVEV